MGLGTADAVGLVDAREAALLARKALAAGQNPIEARREARRSQMAVPSFGEIADGLLQSKESEWRNAKHREQWRTALKDQAAALRPRPVDEIDTTGILEVLKPLWSAKPETASRLRGRIEAVLDAANAKGYRTGENPARWRGHLSIFYQSVRSSRAAISPSCPMRRRQHSSRSCESRIMLGRGRLNSQF